MIVYFPATPSMEHLSIDPNIIDRRLEYLLNRMERTGHDVRSKWPHQTEEEIQALLDTNAAYLDACYRYNRQAPSIVDKYNLKNNGAQR